MDWMLDQMIQMFCDDDWAVFVDPDDEAEDGDETDGDDDALDTWT